MATGYSGPKNKTSPLSRINEQTGDYTLVLLDDGALVDMNSASALTVTIPTNASVSFRIGAQVLIRQKGAGAVTVEAAAGVTLDLVESEATTSAQNAVLALLYIATNTWLLAGRSTA
ncbi:MAG: hypothetical protein Q8R28_07915 [Dehalococcoidia bacterium]|nr:hypothetical protein [Dehalococcoidia bacterium]